MIVWQMFAFVLNEEIIQITHCESYEEANRIAKAVYGEPTIAVGCLQYPCQVGDRYRNGEFYEIDRSTQEEILIERIPTQEEQVQQLQTEKEATEEYSIDLDYRLSCLELGI